MSKFLLLLSFLCITANVYAQGKVEKVTFERGMDITIERSRPDTDHSSAHESRREQQRPLRVKSPLEAAREEVQRLLALIDDPVSGPALANNPDLQKDHLNRLRDTMAYVRMLEDQERRAAAAREAAAREDAARKNAEREKVLRQNQRRPESNK